MSQWTHVAGLIRFDSLRLTPELEKELKPELGSTCKFNSSRDEWKNCNVPRGSEGSLQ